MIIQVYNSGPQKVIIQQWICPKYEERVTIIQFSIQAYDKTYLHGDHKTKIMQVLNFFFLSPVSMTIQLMLQYRIRKI